MATLGNKKKKPLFGLSTGGTFFSSYIFILSFLTVINPTSALATRDIKSPKFIPAKAAIVVDPNMAVIYAKNPDAKLPPASTTKLITAMVVLDHLGPDAVIKISPNASRVHSVSPRLRADEELTVTDLLHVALMKSVNSAAVALAEGVAGSEEAFVEFMNQKAQAVGATNTIFANASGLPEGTQYTTVYDLTLILNEALKYPLIKEILGKRECRVATLDGRNLFIKSTDKLLWATDNMIGGKTGFTSQAQHCFVGALQTESGPIFGAILGTQSRGRLWRSAKMLFSLGASHQGSEFKVVSDDSSRAKRRHAKFKKGRKIRHALKQRDENRIIDKPFIRS